MRRGDELISRSIREDFSELTLDLLKPLAALVGEPPTRKGELVDLLSGVMEDREKVRALYARLSEVNQRTVQEATHDLEGILHLRKFRAKYGQEPNFGGSGSRYYGKDNPPSKLRLFFPRHQVLPDDLLAILETFVPEPPPMKVEASDVLPGPDRAATRRAPDFLLRSPARMTRPSSEYDKRPAPRSTTSRRYSG